VTPTLVVPGWLADGKEYGSAVVEDIQRFAGIRLGRGTLYRANTVESHDRRQPYRLSPAGREYLKQHVAGLDKVRQTAARRLEHV
jgi:DNA-binding PadR family transcriptional regulator